MTKERIEQILRGNIKADWNETELDIGGRPRYVMMSHRGIKTILEDKLTVGWRDTDCGDYVNYVDGIDEAAEEIANVIVMLIQSMVK